MDMYISLRRLRHLEHRKTDVMLLELGTQAHATMREINELKRAGLGTMRHELLHLIDDMPTLRAFL